MNISSVSYSTVSKLQNYNNPKRVVISKGKGYPLVFAYWIFGTKGESKMLRLLKAIYHPRNQYMLQLDDTSSDSERMDLAISVKSFKVFEDFENVNVIGKSYAINKMNPEWDWFITLSASGYSLMTQDDKCY
jgi:protein xylosyltransferase